MIIAWFETLSPVTQALLATCFTWLLTAVGAGSVFFFKTIDQKILDATLGFAAGIMIAASFWSLLAPALEIAGDAGSTLPAFVPVTAGFMTGGVLLWAIDRILPHLHQGYPPGKPQGISTTWQRSMLLILAVTLHNIPEGLTVGVAFGALAAHSPAATLGGAVTLALGMGIQNMLEGMAVSVPLRREGMSRRRSFWYGQLSGLVEPAAGVLGAIAVTLMHPLLPFALSFAAGAMMFVVVEELIPESQLRKETDLATMGALVGFALMMILDATL
jgi:ZIP family zinc transporter